MTEYRRTPSLSRSAYDRFANPSIAQISCAQRGADDLSDPGEEDPQRAALDRRMVGPFDAVRITYHRHITDEDLPPIKGGDGFLVLLVAGSTVLHHERAEASVGPGDMVLADSSRPLHVQRSGRVVLIAVRIPSGVLDERVARWRDRSGRPLSRGASALIGSLVRSAFEQVVNSPVSQSEALGEALLTLIAAASVEREEAEVSAAHAPRIVRTIQNYLLTRLGDTSLTPQQIARSHGLSERQLHRVFQNAGVSLGRWIRQTRLDRCAADLANPSLRDRSITDIAFEWGYNDAAHFSRAFRAEFDRTPREYRASALSARSAGGN